MKQPIQRGGEKTGPRQAAYGSGYKAGRRVGGYRLPLHQSVIRAYPQDNGLSGGHAGQVQQRQARGRTRPRKTQSVTFRYGSGTAHGKTVRRFIKAAVSAGLSAWNFMRYRAFFRRMRAARSRSIFARERRTEKNFPGEES